MIGIYKITNIINNKIYIGQSVNIERRWTQYKNIYDTYFSNKISYRGFEKIWSGITWKHIMPEVFSEENKNYYKTTAKGNIGENNSFTKVNDKIVNEMRKEYQEKSISEIAEKYKDILSYSAVERILLGITYKHLPKYKKKENKWITL